MYFKNNSKTDGKIMFLVRINFHGNIGGCRCAEIAAGNNFSRGYFSVALSNFISPVSFFLCSFFFFINITRDHTVIRPLARVNDGVSANSCQKNKIEYGSANGVYGIKYRENNSSEAISLY